MAKFELSLGSISIKIGADSTTVNKSAHTALPYANDVGRYMQYSSMMDDLLFFGKQSTTTRYIKECPQVGSILFNKCNAYINGKMSIVNDDEEHSHATSSYAKRMQALIERPNILQNGKQFWSGVKFFIQAYGYCVVLRNKNEVRGEVSDMWILHPEYTTITFTKDLPYYKTDFMELVESIKVTTQGNKTSWTVPKEDVYIFTDTTPLRTDSYLPSSRLDTLKNPIENLIKGYKTEGRIISKPLVAFSRKDSSAMSATIKDDDKNAVNKIFSSKYGTEYDNQSDVIFLSAAVDVQQLMYPIAQLQIFEGRSANAAIVCDGLGYPFDLMGKDKGATYSNGQTADTILYQNHIIPEAGQIDQQIIECLMLLDYGVKCRTTYDHVPSLQGNLKEKAEVRNINTHALLAQFVACLIKFDEMIGHLGNKEINQKFSGKFFNELDPTDQEYFKISIKNGSNQTGSGGTQGQANNSNQAGN